MSNKQNDIINEAIQEGHIMTKHTPKKCNDNTKEAYRFNRNFVAYCKFNNLAFESREIKLYDFICWVNKKASEFRKIHNLSEYHPISRLESWARYIENGK